MNGEAAPGGNVARLSLWDDNPATADLLGFDAVVDTIAHALEVDSLDPVTIGIHSPWGGGKSTVLALLDDRLMGDSDFVVIRTDPWKYDDHADVRGTLIAEILHALGARFGQSADVEAKVRNLIQRISWSRAASAIAKGALTMQWDLPELVKAFTPRKPETPETMDGFREEFASLLGSLEGVRRVVVLVDDLDRCLPDAVMATLEAIKLFLAVPRVAFVLATDQDMVRDAIAASLDATGRSDLFAGRYLEKIVQLPVHLPRLTLAEAETYIALLLAALDAPDKDSYQALTDHVQDRRHRGAEPAFADLDGLPYRPSDATLLLAGRLALGLRADRVSNPRQIKRFLNAFGVRQSIAAARRLTVDAGVIAKLMLLEDRYPSDFETLVAAPADVRDDLIARWERWATGEVDEKPQEISDGSREWAAADPPLREINLGDYLALAASLTSVAASADLSDELARIVILLAGESDTYRQEAQEKVVGRSETERRLVVRALLERAGRTQDVTAIVESLVAMAKADPALGRDVATGLRERCWTRLDISAAYDLATCGVPELVECASALSTDPSIEAAVQAAAASALGAD